MTEAEPRLLEVHFDTVEELDRTFNESILKGGYFFPCPDPSPRTTPVQLKFSLPGLPEPLSIEGEVAYAATAETPMPGLGTGMAIQFEKMTDTISKAFQAAITIARAEGMSDPGAAPGEEGTEFEPETDDGDDEGEEADEGGEAQETSNRAMMMKLNQLTSENLYPLLRSLPLHQKVGAAKRGNRNVRSILMQEGNKKIMTYLLQNPQFGPTEVIQMLKMSNLSMEIIQMIAKNSQWNQNEEIKYLIVIHPKTPLPLAMNLMNSLNINNLAKIAKSGFKAQLKGSAVKLLELRRKNS